MRVEEFTRLKKEVEKLKRQKLRAEGALALAEEQLEKVLGVKVEEAEECVARMARKVGGLKDQVEQELEEFEEEWGDKLREM